MALEIAVGDGKPRDVDVSRRGDGATVWIDGQRHDARLESVGDGARMRLDERDADVHVVAEHDTVHVHAFGRAWQLELTDPLERARREHARDDAAIAPMPGTVILVAVAEGEAVAAGQRLVVIESMKMQSEIASPREGTVEQVLAQAGDTCDRGARLVALVPLAED